jgi:hypothetical protein
MFKAYNYKLSFKQNVVPLHVSSKATMPTFSRLSVNDEYVAFPHVIRNVKN